MANPRPGKRRITDEGGSRRAPVAPTRRTAEPFDDDRTSRHRPWVQITVWVVVIAMVLSGVGVLLTFLLA
jgi:hypothetical protein